MEEGFFTRRTGHTNGTGFTAWVKWIDVTKVYCTSRSSGRRWRQHGPPKHCYHNGHGMKQRTVLNLNIPVYISLFLYIFANARATSISTWLCKAAYRCESRLCIWVKNFNRNYGAMSENKVTRLEGSCTYTEYAVAGSRQGVILSTEVARTANNPST